MIYTMEIMVVMRDKGIGFCSAFLQLRFEFW